MTIIINNLTGNTLYYLSGVISVPANSSLTVPSNYIFPISKDSDLISDCTSSNVNLSDGTQIYGGSTAITYLNQIATSIGGAVVGLIGSLAPSYVITVGGKDVNGNSQAMPLGQNNEVKVGILNDQTGDQVAVTHRYEVKVAETIRLVGDTQEGTTLDTNIWTSTLTGSGGIVLGHALAQLTTGTTANSSSFLVSNRKARFITGTVNSFTAGIRLGDTGTANNVRRWGAYDANNGVYFQLNGTTIGVGIRQTAVDNIIISFNGHTPVLDTNFHLYEICYTQGTVHFFQDNLLIHSYTTTTAAIADTPHFLLGFENTNSGGGTSNVSLYIRGSAISRYGVSNARPLFKYLNTAVTTMLKMGPGTLHKIIINNPGISSAILTLYDNTTNSGTIIGSISVGGISTSPTTIEIGADFNIGLTAVMSSASASVTVIYD